MKCKRLITVYLATSLEKWYWFLIKTFKNPFSACDTGNGEFGQCRDCITEPIHDFSQAGKDLIAEAALANLFPDLLDRIHFRRVRRNMEQQDILRDVQCTGLVPCCTIAAQQDDIVRVFPGQTLQKYIHTHRIALRKHQKETISCPGFHSSEGIVILPDVVAGHTGASKAPRD